MDTASGLKRASPEPVPESSRESTCADVRVLFIAYEYPPLSGAGIRRSLILSRHLPEFGITPVVLTTDLVSCQRDKGDVIDLQLLEKIPSRCIIERIPTHAPLFRLKGKMGFWMRSLFVLTDSVASRWQAEVMRRLPDILSRHQPKAIYVTLPPFSLAKLACALARKTKLPVLLDFRDLWSQCGHTPHVSWLHYHSLLRIERNCLREATAVVCVTEQVKRDMLAAQPSAQAAKFRVIPNGFDSAIPNAQQLPTRSNPGQPFLIGHVGSFYYSPAARQAILRPWWRRKPTRWTQFSPRKEDWLYRSPYFFFRGLSRLLEVKPELREHIRVRFVGARSKWLDEQVLQFHLADVVEFLGTLNLHDCLQFQSKCDCLLITSAKVLEGEDYCISSKTFEYLTTGKPILAVVATGAQRDFLVNSGVAQVCDPDDSEATARGIEMLLSGHGALRPNYGFLDRFKGREISRSMAEVLHGICREVGAAA